MNNKKHIDRIAAELYEVHIEGMRLQASIGVHSLEQPSYGDWKRRFPSFDDLNIKKHHQYLTKAYFRKWANRILALGVSI